ncbi:MAG: CAP domain-containing protein [Mahellales bacterium]|jgi:uncharacterized YkwD family protein
MIKIIKTMVVSLVLASLLSGCALGRPFQIKVNPRGDDLSGDVIRDHLSYDDDDLEMDHAYQPEVEDGGIMDPVSRKSLETKLLEQDNEFYEDQQQEMAALINKEREINGLKPLKVDGGLSQLARLSADDIRDDLLNGGDGSTESSIEEIMASFRVEYITCGVNMASGTTAQFVHGSFMECEENRDIILNPDFTHVGIGVIKDDTRFNKLYTQLFVQVVSWEPVVDEEQETYMLELLNNERAQNGLKPLTLNEKLVEAARLKSIDLVKKDYFDHYSPTYGTPFELLEKLGIDFDKAGENLAGNMDTLEAHRGLMASEGHRANILDSEYNQVGIGVVKGGRYGRIYTQLFIDD